MLLRTRRRGGCGCGRVERAGFALGADKGGLGGARPLLKGRERRWRLRRGAGTGRREAGG